MEKIYKYGPVPSWNSKDSLQVPGRIVKCGLQAGEIGREIFVWAIQDSENEEINISHLKYYPTGYEFDGDYIDTVFTGPFVWHIIRN